MGQTVGREGYRRGATIIDSVDRTRLASACLIPHSGERLTALTITSCIFCLDNQEVQLAVGLSFRYCHLPLPYMSIAEAALGSKNRHGLVVNHPRDNTPFAIMQNG